MIWGILAIVSSIVLIMAAWMDLKKAKIKSLPATGRVHAFKQSIKWIRSNRHKRRFKGCWIALDGDTLLVYDHSRKTAQGYLEAIEYPLNRVLFFKIRDDND